MERNLGIMEILQMIKKGEISPEEGQKRIKKLKQGTSAEQQKRDFEDLVSRAQESYLQRTYAMMGELQKGEVQKGEVQKEELQKEEHPEQPLPTVSVKDTDVAVIGMSGKFPGAENIDIYWDNLKKGVDSVKEIPKDRWDWKMYYDEDPKAANKSVSKWMGALDGVKEFDPLFFNLSHAEAELMDPQQRKFLEESWKAIEDAGYSSEEMNEKKCGVFVGALTGDYMMLTKSSGKPLNALFLTGSGNSFISARIAYMLNLKGPNMSIDTACSSSMVAIYEAYKSIVENECEMALAGGVCVMATPDMHLTTSKAGLLSASGGCKAFDDNADGIVLSEGVGVIVLKKLANAIEDRDHIYGVIKGGLINQDGKTNGITSPSAIAQTQLETECYNKYGINPEDISYIECHGTGTKLGDPIEISALTNTFEHFTNKKQFCNIGSVKANIGHGLAASGIASVIKVLLSLQYKKLVPSIHYQKENHLINFTESPFKVNTMLTDWETDGKERIAAVSSFGLSGTNCHMILGEAPQIDYFVREYISKKLFVISAKTEAAFTRRINELIVWLQNKGGNYRLQDIAYILLNGRKHFPIRTAIIASTREELIEKLKMVLENKEHADIILGNLYQNAYFMATDEGENAGDEKKQPNDMDKIGVSVNLEELGKKYCEGKMIPYNLYNTEKCYRISMPSYPFEKDIIWIQKENPGQDFYETKQVLHPLIDSNVSTLEEQCFKKTFSQKDSCIGEHVIQGEMVLPGAAYLEMAYNAARFATRDLRVKKLKDIIWERPLKLDGDSKDVFINFYEENQDVCFSIFSGQPDDSRLIHASGKVEFDESLQDENKCYDISGIKERCKKMEAGKSFYEGFAKLGLNLGQTFQTVNELFGNDREVLAKICLAPDIENVMEGYTLYPGMLDGALQTAAGLVLDKLGGKDAMYLPFGLKELKVYRPLTKVVYSYILPNDEQSFKQEVRFNVNILDEQGRLLAELKEVVGRLFVKNEKTIVMSPKQTNVEHGKKERVAELLKQLENGDLKADEVERILEEM